MAAEAFDQSKVDQASQTSQGLSCEQTLHVKQIEWLPIPKGIGQHLYTVTTRSNELLARLGIEDLDLILKERRLRWYGHVERSNGVVRTAFDLQVDGKHGPGRPKMTWKQLTDRDYREKKLPAIDPHDRHTWRSGVRSVISAASQLPGRGPTDVDVVPVPAD